MKTIKTILTILSFCSLYVFADAQGNCPGDKIKVYRGATGCGCSCQKECVTPAELPVYIENGWNTVGCWNCCKAKNWVDAGMPKISPDELHLHAEPGLLAEAFRLASKRDVKIRVTDMIGRYVATISDAFVEDENHALLLDQSGLEPGMYICQVQSAGFSETKRISVTE